MTQYQTDWEILHVFTHNYDSTRNDDPNIINIIPTLTKIMMMTGIQKEVGEERQEGKQT